MPSLFRLNILSQGAFCFVKIVVFLNELCDRKVRKSIFEPISARFANFWDLSGRVAIIWTYCSARPPSLLVCGKSAKICFVCGKCAKICFVCGKSCQNLYSFPAWPPQLNFYCILNSADCHLSMRLIATFQFGLSAILFIRPECRCIYSAWVPHYSCGLGAVVVIRLTLRPLFEPSLGAVVIYSACVPFIHKIEKRLMARHFSWNS